MEAAVTHDTPLKKHATLRVPRTADLTGAAVTAVFLIAGCAARPLPPPTKRPPPPPTRDFALLSSLGEESGLKITAVDNIPLEQLAASGRRPANAPAGLHSGMGVWLTPGIHLIHVQYARNIASGISFTQGNLRVAVAPGHTYIVRPGATSDFGAVSFALIDHGTAFPIRCLPWHIGQTTALDARGRRTEFSVVDVLACREYSPP